MGSWDADRGIWVEHLRAKVGEHWSVTLRTDLVSWTGWTAKAQIRAYRGAPDVLVELSCATGVETIDGVEVRVVTVGLPASAGVLDTGPLTGYWDLLVKPTGGRPQYIAEGNVHITDRVTIPA